jgi:hypothetical protein
MVVGPGAPRRARVPHSGAQRWIDCAENRGCRCRSPALPTVRGLTGSVKRAAPRTDAGRVRMLLPLVAAVALLTGCRSSPPDEDAVNRALVSDTVLQWHALQVARDPKACELVTDHAVEEMLAFERKTASAVGTAAPSDCEAMIAARPDSESYRALMLATVVDAVEVEGSRATATVHTSVTLRGVARSTDPVPLELRWDSGRWRLD